MSKSREIITTCRYVWSCPRTTALVNHYILSGGTDYYCSKRSVTGFLCHVPNLSFDFLRLPSASMLLNPCDSLSFSVYDLSIRLSPESLRFRFCLIESLRFCRSLWLSGFPNLCISSNSKLIHITFKSYCEGRRKTPLPSLSQNTLSQKQKSSPF